MSDIDPSKVQWDNVGMPQGVGQFGPGTKYTPDQMAQLNASRDALRAAEARGESYTYNAIDPGKVQWDQPPTQPRPVSAETPPPAESGKPNMARMSYPLMLGGMYGPDIAMGARQVLDAGAEGLASLFGKRQQAAQVNQAALDAYKQKYGEIPGSGVARGVGQGVTTAAAIPIRAAGVIGTAVQGAGQGALTNMLTPAYGVSDQSYAATKAQQAKEGAIAGGTLAGGLGLAGKVFGPTASAEALRAEGVTPTLGQQMGGMWKALEEKATSIPILGDAIKYAQGAGLNDFNRAIYNRILAPLGEKYTGPVGQKGLAVLDKKLGDAYDATLSKMVPSPLTDTFNSGVDNLRSMLASRPDSLKTFDAVMNGEVWQRFSPENTLTPSKLKEADSALGTAIRDYFNRGSPDEVNAARALAEAQRGLRQMGAEANPQQAERLRAIDRGFAQLVQLQNAAKTVKVARNEGVVTPADYLRGIKSGDVSARDRIFSKGEALNQDLAQAADKTLSSTYPDSGSIGRGIIAAAAAGHFAPPLLAGALAASVPYLPAARKVAGSTVGLLGDLAKTAPYLGFLGPGAAGLLSQ